MFSGGAGSWAAAKRVAQKHGTENLVLLFTDTLMEDSDLYRFLVECACNVFGETPPTQFLNWLKTLPEFHEDQVRRKSMLETARKDIAEILPGLVWIAEGRDPWEVFRDERMLGNSRIDPCSKILKRQVADRWLKQNCDPATTIVYVGMDWTEGHRYDDGDGGGAKNRYAKNGWICEAPMCEAPYHTKQDVLRDLAKEGIELSHLYKLGAAHNNCSGWCCKAGQGHFAWLFRVMPMRYRCYEGKEQDMRYFLDRDVAVMAEVSEKMKKPLTMRTLRQRIEKGGQVDMFEIGGCGCFSEESELDLLHERG